MSGAITVNQLGARQPSHVTVATASLIGTAIEWYDFFLYGTAAALVFNKLFFPKSDPLTGAMLAFATYALAMIQGALQQRNAFSARLVPRLNIQRRDFQSRTIG